MEFYEKNMRVVYGETLVELGEEYSKLLVLDADIFTTTQTLFFKERFPDRFIECGIAEANMFGVACGLAAQGFVTVPSTFATFVARKGADPIFSQGCVQNLNLKISGSLPGLTSCVWGPSHNGGEDLAFMRNMCNMRVAAPADNNELRSFMHTMMEEEGPMYFRVIKGEVPKLFGEDHKFTWGKGDVLMEGTDVTIVGTGLTSGCCLEAGRLLARKGISAEVIHMGSIKPIDSELLIRSARKTGCVITAENHRQMGGMGSAVAEVLCQNEPVKMKMLGLGDKVVVSGSVQDLLKYYELHPAGIARSTEEFLRSK